MDLGDVANQIKENDACSNIVSNTFPVDPTPLPDPGVGSKGQNAFFLNMVTLYFKLKGITNAATCKHILCLTNTLGPWGGIKGQNIFSEKKSFCISN